MTKHLFSKFLIVGIVLLGFFGGFQRVHAQANDSEIVQSILRGEGDTFARSRNATESQKALLTNEINRLVSAGILTPAQKISVEGLGLSVPELQATADQNFLRNISSGTRIDLEFARRYDVSTPEAKNILRSKLTTNQLKSLDDALPAAQAQNQAGSNYFGTSETRGFNVKNECPANISFSSPTSYITQIINYLFTCIVIPVLGYLLSFIGEIFDLSIKVSVVDFAAYANMPVFRDIWAVGRDLSNIFFIFILLYSAFDTLLGLNKKPFDQVIEKIIIVAILINFSFPITRIFVDISNVFSYELYKVINVDGTLSTVVAKNLAALGKTSLNASGGFEKFDTATGQAAPNQEIKLEFWAVIVNFFGTTIVMITFGITLLLASLFFVYRTVTLLILMTFSALAFFAQIVPNPKASKYYSDWWGTLLDQAIFAPTYLLFLYFALRVLSLAEGLQQGNIGNSSATSLIGLGSIGIAIYYIMLVLILNAALVLAKDYGAVGASTAMSWAESSRDYLLNKPKQLGQYIGGGALGAGQYVVGGAANFVGRETVGRAAGALAKTAPVQYLAKTFPTYGGATPAKYLKDLSGKSFGQEELTENAISAAQMYRSRDKIGDQVRVFAQMDKKTRGQAFEKLSDREKVALENAIDLKIKDANGNDTPVDMFDEPTKESIRTVVKDYTGTPENQDKYDKAKKEAKDAEKKRETKTKVDDLIKKMTAADTSGTAFTLEDAEKKLITGMPKDVVADNKKLFLKIDTLEHLTVPQFKKLLLDGNLEQGEIAQIYRMFHEPATEGRMRKFEGTQTDPGIKDIFNSITDL